MNKQSSPKVYTDDWLEWINVTIEVCTLTALNVVKSLFILRISPSQVVERIKPKQGNRWIIGSFEFECNTRMIYFLFKSANTMDPSSQPSTIFPEFKQIELTLFSILSCTMFLFYGLSVLTMCIDAWLVANTKYIWFPSSTPSHDAKPYLNPTIFLSSFNFAIVISAFSLYRTYLDIKATAKYGFYSFISNIILICFIGSADIKITKDSIMFIPLSYFIILISVNVDWYAIHIWLLEWLCIWYRAVVGSFLCIEENGFIID